MSKETIEDLFKEDLDTELVSFLESNEALDAYILNSNNYMYSLDFYSRVKYVKDKLYNQISGAFIWSNTSQGAAFWANMRIAYRNERRLQA